MLCLQSIAAAGCRRRPRDGGLGVGDAANFCLWAVAVVLEGVRTAEKFFSHSRARQLPIDIK